MIQLSPPQIMKCSATYVDGRFFIQVPMDREGLVEDIADYIERIGVSEPIWIYTPNSIPNELSGSNQNFVYVDANSLEELVVRSSQLIDRKNKVQIDGRLPPQQSGLTDVADYEMQLQPRYQAKQKS